MMADDELREWAEGCRDHVDALAEGWGAGDAVRADTRMLIAPLQAHAASVSFETDPIEDQRALHSTLAACLAEHLIRSFGARWASSAADPGARVVALGGREADTFELAHREIVHRPISVVRMFAMGEAALGATSPAAPGA